MTDPTTLDLDAIENAANDLRGMCSDEGYRAATGIVIGSAHALVAEVRRLQGRKPGDPVWSAEFDRLHEVIAELRAQRDAIKQALIFGAYDAVVSSLTLHTVGCTCGECAQLLEALGIELRAQRARGELGVLRAQRDAAPNETQLLREAQQEAHEAAALRAQRNAVLDQPEGN